MTLFKDSDELKIKSADGRTSAIALSSENAIFIGPSGLDTSADRVAIQAAINDNRQIYLLSGAVYYLDQALTLPANAALFGTDASKPAIIRPTTSFAPLSSQADVDSNAVLKLESTIGSLLGTMQTAVRQRKTTIRVNFNPSTGSWLRLKSITGQEGQSGLTYGADVVGFEVVKVKSTASAGGGNYDVTLDQPLQQSHGVGTEVNAISTMVENVTINGIYLDFNGRNVAVGVLVRSAAAINLNIHARGFSKAEILVCDGGRKNDLTIYSYKGSNSSIFLRSSSAKIKVKTDEQGDRVHAQGVPRGLITLRHASTYVEIYDTELIGGTCGISGWGGNNIRIRDTIIRDMDFTDRASRDTEVVAITGEGQVGGAGIDLGAFDSPSNYGEFNYGVSIQNVKLVNCGGTNANFLHTSAWFVDCYGLWLDGIEVINTGAGAGSESTPYISGLTFYDTFDVNAGSLRFHGVERPIALRGTVRGNFDNVNIWQADAYTGNTLCFLVNAMVSGDDDAQSSNVSFGTVSCGTQDGSPFYKDSVAVPAEKSWRCIFISKFIWGHNVAGRAEWDNLQFAYNDTGVTILSGEMVELDQATVSSTACLSLSNPSSTNQVNKAVLVTGVFSPGVDANSRQCVNNTWGVISFGPVMSVKTTATPTFGQKLVPANPPSRDTEISDGYDSDFIGVVTRTKNTQNLVRVHRVPSGSPTIPNLIPLSIQFAAVTGTKTVSSNTFESLGTVAFDPSDLFTGSAQISRAIIFQVILECTSGVTAEVRLWNLSTGAAVTGSTLTSTSTTPEIQNATLSLGASPNMPNSLQLYEVQLRISSPSSPTPFDQAICKSAEIIAIWI